VEKTIAALDTEYQDAVKRNDVAVMDRLLADNFTLVTGSGKSYSKADLLDDARSGHILYDHQEDSNQTVRVWGDTAVISAKLKASGTQGGKPFDYTVYFSDTYVRTPTGWRYVFGQSSLPLPKAAEHAAPLIFHPIVRMRLLVVIQVYTLFGNSSGLKPFYSRAYFTGLKSGASALKATFKTA